MLITMPTLQKPHCEPLALANFSDMGLVPLVSFSPSIVVICGVHERTVRHHTGTGGKQHKRAH